MLEMSMRWPPVHDLPNPAKSIVLDGTLEFGITIPFYNGEEAFMSGGRFGGGARGLDLARPTLTKDQPGNLPRGYRYRGMITKPAVHEIEWQIHLVPEPGPLGYWEYTAREGVRLFSFIDALFQRKPGSVPHEQRKWLHDPTYRRRFVLPGPWTLRVHPMPSAPQFMSHLLAHECQHVEDHAWLAQEILGPLDEWHDRHHERRTEFIAGDSQYNLDSILLAGTAETATRLIQYWQNAIRQSGDVFHDTHAGAHPDLRVRAIARDDDVRSPGVVDLEVEPVALLQYSGFDLDDPRPHGWPANVFNVQTGRLGGNEPVIAHQSKNSYRRRVVDYGREMNHQMRNYVAVDDGDASDSSDGEGFGAFGAMFRSDSDSN